MGNAMVGRLLGPVLRLPVFKEAVVVAADAHLPHRYEHPGYQSAAGDLVRKGIASFGVLRQMAEVHEPTRGCIWERIRQVQSAEWELRLDGEPKDGDAQLERAYEYFGRRGGLGGPGKRFRHFIAEALEDLLVLDALPVYRQKNRGGGIYASLLIDGGTIYPQGDERGYLPEPPAAAFKQQIQGQVTGNYTTDEMRYYCINPRTNSLYGMSPVECIIGTVESSLRATSWNKGLFTDGNIPPGMLEMPEKWSPEQMKAWGDYWDSLLTGNADNKHRLRRVPVGVKYTPFMRPDEMQFEKFQIWLLRLTCMIFGLSPAVLGFAGEQYKVAADTQVELATKWGLRPLLLFLKEVFDDVLVEDVGTPDIGFHWKRLDTEDELATARAARAWGATVMTPNEMRELAGLRPVEGRVANMLFSWTAQGPVVVGSTQEAIDEPYMPGPPGMAGQAGRPFGSLGAPTPKIPEAEPPGNAPDTKALPAPTDGSAWEQDLRRFQRKALRALERGERPDVPFESAVVPGEIIAEIQEALYAVETPEQVEAVFAAVREPEKPTLEDELRKLPAARRDRIMEQEKLLVEMTAGWASG